LEGAETSVYSTYGSKKKQEKLKGKKGENSVEGKTNGKRHLKQKRKKRRKGKKANNDRVTAIPYQPTVPIDA
jgi:hypothetical protein